MKHPPYTPYGCNDCLLFDVDAGPCLGNVTIVDEFRDEWYGPWFVYACEAHAERLSADTSPSDN